jgi:hypothetical protein
MDKKMENRKIIFNQMIEDSIEIKATINISEDELCTRIPIEKIHGKESNVFVVFNSLDKTWIDMMMLISRYPDGSERRWLLTGKNLKKWAWLPIFNRKKAKKHVVVNNTTNTKEEKS